jgi:hypothetical protein
MWLHIWSIENGRDTFYTGMLRRFWSDHCVHYLCIYMGGQRSACVHASLGAKEDIAELEWRDISTYFLLPLHIPHRLANVFGRVPRCLVRKSRGWCVIWKNWAVCKSHLPYGSISGFFGGTNRGSPEKGVQGVCHVMSSNPLEGRRSTGRFGNRVFQVQTLIAWKSNRVLYPLRQLSRPIMQSLARSRSTPWLYLERHPVAAASQALTSPKFAYSICPRNHNDLMSTYSLQ